MYEIAQHTADVRILVSAASLEELFRDAVRGLMSVLSPDAPGETETMSIALEAPDLTALLVDFLNEILLRCHTERQSCELEVMTIEGDRLTAQLLATTVTGFDEDVKAVTYHEAEVVQLADGTWTTTLVLDL